MRVARARISVSMLPCVGSRCRTMMNPMPVSGGSARNSWVSASTPPADAPMPTIGNDVPLRRSACDSSSTMASVGAARCVLGGRLEELFFEGAVRLRAIVWYSRFRPRLSRVQSRRRAPVDRSRGQAYHTEMFAQAGGASAPPAPGLGGGGRGRVALPPHRVICCRLRSSMATDSLHLSAPTPVPLRRRLFLLAAVGILPVAIMSGIGLYVLARQQRAQAESVGVELARAVATAVDASLRSSIAVLEALATSDALDRGDLAAFHDRARRAMIARPEWTAVVLAAPSGARVLDTRGGEPSAMPPVADRESLDRAVRMRTATVGNLFPGIDGALAFRVRVPVER